MPNKHRVLGRLSCRILVYSKVLTSITESALTYIEDDTELNWYVGLSGSQYEFTGSESVSLTVTVVHPQSPAPGTYRIAKRNRFG